MTTATRTLSTVISANPYCDPIRDGTVKIPGVELEQKSITPFVQAFRRMTRSLEFEVCEVAVVTYFTAKQYNIPITAIPVFPLARFEHGLIYYNENVVQEPKQLEGKTAGVRAYTVTPGVWAREFLHAEHGLDLSKVTWYIGDDEHVIQYHDGPIPPNVQYHIGDNLQALLAEGKLAAGLQVQPGEHKHIKPWYPDGRAAGIAAYERMGGIYPVTHLMCVRDDVLKEMPWLAGALVEAFKEAKEIHRQKTGAPKPAHIYDDPVPIGMDATREAMRVLMDYCVQQGVMYKALDIDEIVPGNYN